VVRDDLPKLNTTINWPVKIQMLKQKKAARSTSRSLILGGNQSFLKLPEGFFKKV